MRHPPLTRHARRAALALAASLSAACGGDPKPAPTPDPPQVQLNVPEAVVAGQSLKFIVTVSGCDAVSSLNVYDRDAFLKSFAYAGGTVTLELASADIPYRTAGLAANLSLRAEAVCDDGRKNFSQHQPATFFPVSRVLDDAQAPQQVFNMPFIVEGSGTNAAFWSCSGPRSGVHTLYRQPSTGAAQTLAMPTLCTPDTVITAPVNGKRWVWTPGSSAFAVDASFQVTARSRADREVGSLTVMPNGDALIRSEPGGRIARQAHDADQERWFYPGEQQPVRTGTPITPAMVRSDGAVVFATHVPDGEGRAEIAVTVLDATTGARVGDDIVIRDLLSSTGTPAVPSAALSADGRVLYLGFPQASNQGQVLACAADAAGCEGGNLRWTSTVLAAPIKAVVPYANGSRVAAVGAQRVWPLDAATGAIRAKDGASVDANGALNVLYVQPGRPPSSDVYFLTGPARTTGGATLPVEIVGMDQSSAGDGRELFRFQPPVSLGAAVDDEGRLWLRTGGKLLQTLPSNQYRSARP